MRLTVLKIKEEKSRQGGKCWLICFTSDLGTSFKTWIYPQYGNYTRNHWNEVVARGAGAVLDYGNLPINSKGLLNADITFRLLSSQPEPRGETTNETARQAVS